MKKQCCRLKHGKIKGLKCAYHNCTHGLTRTRYQAVWLYGLGYSIEQIEEITNVSQTSVMAWWKVYHDQGIDGLTDGRRDSSQRRLTTAQLNQLKDRLHTLPPAKVLDETTACLWTVAHLKIVVKKWFDVSYRSDTSYQKLFKRCGFNYDYTTRAYRSVSGVQTVSD